MTTMGDEALIGRVLDERYVIGERIARGGMASVFIATDTRLDRVVAVKVMHTGLGDDGQFTQRFVREAQSAAKLNHPNVVAVFDQGFDGDVTYLVMEYVAGVTLRDILRKEAPMSPRRALSFIEQVLIALSAAHAANIIHRDVKPENVLINPRGEVKVADFGLARAVSSATTAAGGTLIGTVSYLAPEIVTNSGADARSDVYACGAMLYEMLTGSKPHAGESPIQVAYKHVHEDVANPSAAVSGIPPYVDALVARATARNRDQRSADAHVFLQQVRLVQRALDEGLDDDPGLMRDLLPASAPATQISDDTEEQLYPSPTDSSDSTTVLSDAATGAATTAIGGPEATIIAEREALPQGPRLSRGLTPPMHPEQYRRTKRAQAKSRRGPVLLAVALVLALLAGLGGWYYGIGRYVDAPSLVGLTAEAALAEAEGAGFSFSIVERRYSEDVPKGDVISTDPDPGDQILPQSEIEAVVSKGKERYKVPKLTGKSVDEAAAILSKINLRVGETKEVFDAKIDKGDVIKTAIKTGTEVKRDTKIDVTVSKGREPVDVTNYEGKSQSEASDALAAAGFKVDVKQVFNKDVNKGIVISQDPNGGTKFRGDTVTLTVSKGPQPIDIPSVIDKRGNEAEKILTDAGFKVDWTPFKIGNARVSSQSPTGTAIRGTVITLSQVNF